MKTILTFLLLVLTGILAIILSLFSFIYTLLKSLLNKNILRDYFYKTAFALDQLGNITCQHIFNDWWIKPEGHRMGSSVDQTISYTMGKNIETNTLYPFGIKIAKLIDYFAYIFVKEKNHCLNAAKNNQNN